MRFANKHGAEHAYTDYDVLLRDPGVKVVFIATPNALRCPQVIAKTCLPARAADATTSCRYFRGGLAGAWSPRPGGGQAWALTSRRATTRVFR